MKAGQGEEEMIILKMNQEVRESKVMWCGRDTYPFKYFVYTPSAVLGLSWFVFLYHFYCSAFLLTANLGFWFIYGDVNTTFLPCINQLKLVSVEW
jgi:hypothetical protein